MGIERYARQSSPLNRNKLNAHVSNLTQYDLPRIRLHHKSDRFLFKFSESYKHD